ncbi:MAG TPA: response regulator transcription factor [bacterium]
MTIRVLVVDDHSVVRLGIRMILQPEPDIEVVGEVERSRDVLQHVRALSPHVVLMDIMLGGGDGIEATRAIKQHCPDVQILIVTAYADQQLFQKAVEAGAVGYVLKDITPTNLASAIRAVHTGKTMINPAVARQMVEHLFTVREESIGMARRQYGITDREMEVLGGVAKGLSDKELGSSLGVSESTVKMHLRAIYSKLKLRNRAQAAVFAVEKGLVTPSLAVPKQSQAVR